MRNQKMFRATAWGLALGLVALTGAARAEEEQKEKKVEHRRVVIVDKDGKRQVFEGGDGPLMRRGFLGVNLTELTPELRAHFGVPEGEGAMVSRVEPGSPAEKAGIKVGDILTSVDGQAVKSSWDVMAKVRGLEDGQQVPLEVWRGGRAQNLTATIAERERSEMDVTPFVFRGGDGGPMVFHLDRDKLQGWKPEDLEKLKKDHIIHLNPGERHRLMVSPREVELEKKLKQLEKRIQELEQQLDRKK